MFNPLRLFSFSDWNRNHPSDQPPGDRLDDAFDSTARAIQEVDYNLGQLRRSDGALQNGIVTRDSMEPGFLGVLASEIKAQIRPDLETVQALASGVSSAQIFVAKETEKAKLAALAATEKAQFVEDKLPALLKTVGRSTDTAYELLHRVETRAADIVNDANDAQYWGNYAYSWGQVSYNWAEYMAGPIPPDILATMGISGNHWSSRWWATQSTQSASDAENWYLLAQGAADDAAAALDQMTDLYLGPHPSNPTLDNDGNPLQVGAIYYNTSDHNMYVWTGTIWQVSNNSQGWVPEAPIDSHTYVRGNATWLQSAGGVADAPNDGKAYARKSVNWSQLTSDDMLFGVGPTMVTGAINLKADTSALNAETAARIAGDQANSASITGLKASQVANDSSVTGVTVKDALNTTAAGIASNASAIALKADITAMNLKAPIDNPVFTGDPRAPTPPAADNDTSIPTTAWVNTAVGAALALKPSVIVSAAAPGAPIDNAMWWESDTGYLFLRYNDGNSAQWVQLNGIPTALQANYVAKAGDTMTGNLVIAPGSGTAQLALNKPVGVNANSVIGRVAGSNRWNLVLGNGSAESSGNAGSDFGINRYDDSGALIDVPLSINRASGNATFSQGVTVTKPWAGAADDAIVIAPTAGAPVLTLNKPIVATSNLVYGKTAGVQRWALILGTSTAESGSNAGSDFSIQRYSDAGTFLDVPLLINRSNATATFTGAIVGNASVNAAGNCVVGGTILGTNLMQLRGANSTYYLTNAGATVNYGCVNFVAADGSVRLNSLNGTGGYIMIDTSGNFVISGNGFKPSGGSWGVASDARIKTVESEYKQGLADVLALNPIVYRYKGNDTPTAEQDGPDMSVVPESPDAPQAKLRSEPGGPATASPHYHVAKAQTAYVGLIAQEVDKIFPGMVTKRKGFIDGQPVDDFHELDTSQLIFALVNAVKELSLKVSNLEAGAR